MDHSAKILKANLGTAKDRRVRLRYTILTAALFIPLLLAFVSIRNVYPFGASMMMLGDGTLQGPRDYYLLRGETLDGATIDLPPIELTNALSGRNWGLVSAAVDNRAFKIRWPHPANIALAKANGGVEHLPRAARLEELLRAWGAIYNSRLSSSSNQRLRAVRLDAYRSQGSIGGEYSRFVESWRA